jgi:hypothetical protein
MVPFVIVVRCVFTGCFVVIRHSVSMAVRIRRRELGRWMRYMCGMKEECTYRSVVDCMSSLKEARIIALVRAES